MQAYLIAIICLVLLVVVMIIIWVCYGVYAAKQQTVSLSVPFEESYRYVPHINKDKKYKLDSIKIKVTGSIKRDAQNNSTITLGSRIKQLVRDTVIDPYKNCLIVQEANIFIMEEKVLKRCPMEKNPTVENLSIIFFNKLGPIMSKIGAQLLAVSLRSEGVKATHSIYKISNYTM